MNTFLTEELSDTDDESLALESASTPRAMLISARRCGRILKNAPFFLFAFPSISLQSYYRGFLAPSTRETMERNVISPVIFQKAYILLPTCRARIASNIAD